jgi:hypothetical protein
MKRVESGMRAPDRGVANHYSGASEKRRPKGSRGGTVEGVYDVCSQAEKSYSTSSAVYSFAAVFRSRQPIAEGSSLLTACFVYRKPLVSEHQGSPALVVLDPDQVVDGSAPDLGHGVVQQRQDEVLVHGADQGAPNCPRNCPQRTWLARSLTPLEYQARSIHARS